MWNKTCPGFTLKYHKERNVERTDETRGRKMNDNSIVFLKMFQEMEKEKPLKSSFNFSVRMRSSQSGY